MPKLPEDKRTTPEEIYKTYEAQPQIERTYLGCSTFGNECDRALWYGLRWANEPEAFTGRKLRLFQTGHREEARIIEDLRSAGVEVFERDPKTDNQFSVAAIGGHLKGHLDGVALGIVEAPKKAHVLECKTHNLKSYTALLKDGVKRSKPGHYAQMTLYMGLMQIDRALYLAVNKNDDSIYAERIHLDPLEVTRLLKRAERIIRAPTPPRRLFEDPSAREAYVCGWCPAREICHEGAFARRNCRTCVSATPIVDDTDEGKWHCDFWAKELTVDEQRAGCEKHLYIPELVPGEQIDADAEARTITYKFGDGSDTWTDGKETE